MKKQEIKFRIDSFEDRRQLAAILADNGYRVKIKVEENNLDDKYFVIVEV